MHEDPHSFSFVLQICSGNERKAGACMSGERGQAACERKSLLSLLHNVCVASCIAGAFFYKMKFFYFLCLQLSSKPPSARLSSPTTPDREAKRLCALHLAVC
mmetsp:Transcript_49395/g.97320  ORF Transcript_49395/g.97320 Transcript_49395/m.97320 type:complete len:102 (+) Transcript_49395:208-513(+)